MNLRRSRHSVRLRIDSDFPAYLNGWPDFTVGITTYRAPVAQATHRNFHCDDGRYGSCQSVDLIQWKVDDWRGHIVLANTRQHTLGFLQSAIGVRFDDSVTFGHAVVHIQCQDID